VLTAVLTTGLVTFGSCWILGFAHHDGLLRRLPPYVVRALAPLFMAAGVWWALGHRTENGWDLDDIPLGQALWSFGFVVVLLRIGPSWERLPRPLARLDGPVTLLNARAVTF